MVTTEVLAFHTPDERRNAVKTPSDVAFGTAGGRLQPYTASVAVAPLGLTRGGRQKLKRVATAPAMAAGGQPAFMRRAPLLVARPDHVVAVGGFAESELLKKRLQAVVGRERLLVPANPSTCVARGGISLLGAEVARVCRFTYGAEANPARGGAGGIASL